MTIRQIGSVLGGALLAITFAAQAQASLEIVTRDDVAFQPLNPLRGDASPKAGVLWGDIKKPMATGTLIRFRDGFSSPPHIHNITYRAVVISGEVHNDDPDAETMWMGPGSFWTQPAGEPHITSARGDDVTAFLEIMEGPYLVQPAQDAFDNGERPVNVEARNVIWLDPSDVSWVSETGERTGVEMAYLWGEPEQGSRNGTFLKVPAGTEGKLQGAGEWLKAVVVAGDVEHSGQEADKTVRLAPGSYFGAPMNHVHGLRCDSGADCLFYVTAMGKFSFYLK